MIVFLLVCVLRMLVNVVWVDLCDSGVVGLGSVIGCFLSVMVFGVGYW